MTVVMLSHIGEEDLITFYRPKGEATDWSHKSSFKLTFTDENLDMIDYTVRDFQLESKQVCSVYGEWISSLFYCYAILGYVCCIIPWQQLLRRILTCTSCEKDLSLFVHNDKYFLNLWSYVLESSSNHHLEHCNNFAKYAMCPWADWVLLANFLLVCHINNQQFEDLDMAYVLLSPANL